MSVYERKPIDFMRSNCCWIRCISCIIVASVAIFSIISSSIASAMPPNEVEQWREDIETYQRELTIRHIDLFHSVSPEEFESKLKQLKRSLPDLSPMEAEVELWATTHLIGGGVSDGHTSIRANRSRYRWAPLSFGIFGNEVRVIGASADNIALNGAKVLMLADTPIDEARNRLKKIAQYTENKYSEEVFIEAFLGCADLLVGLDILEDDKKFEVTVLDSKGESYQIPLLTFKWGERPEILPVTAEGPALLKRPANAFSENLWFRHVPAFKTLFVKFDKIPSAENMATFGEQLVAGVKNNKPRNLIIDLRGNRGGNGFVGYRLAEAVLDEDVINWRDGVYVLIGRKTFSAAMMNAVQFRQVLNARLIGSPTGGNPVGYQDSDKFKLPNSGLEISFSKRLFRLQDENSIGVVPDVEIATTWEDFKAGRDPVIDWVLSDIQSRSRKRAD